MPTVKQRSPTNVGSDSNGSDSSNDVATVDVEGEEDDDSSGSEEEEEAEDEEPPLVAWTGYGKKTAVVLFRADAVVSKKAEIKAVGERFHMAYKIVNTECKLIRLLTGAHGFHEVHPNSSDYNLMWTGSHLKPYVLRGLQEFQKVNHFPRSYEITRKDRLYKNVQKMQQTKGYRNFDFVPHSYIVPGEFHDFCSAFLKDKGPWIVKPIASSRGRGIFLVNHPDQVPLDDTMIVSRYIASPLTIDGFKFDIRLYVAVTSYDPLIIYMYEEGLTRFATVKYDKSNRGIRNQCMHLTNYSVNKKSEDYVKNDDPDVEDYGNKWSLGAMLRYLHSQGRDTTAMMMRVEDVVIKTLISAEMPIATACKMFMPFRGNCFELYGFDILVDENLRPWVLEVNLSPSLACDAPLDLKIKSNMMADLFSLVGFMCHDPMTRKIQQNKRTNDVLTRPPTRSQKSRPQSAASQPGAQRKAGAPASASATGLTGEEIRIVRRAKEEHQRRGGWVRIFPTPDSWELYGSYLQFSSTHNLTLYQQLFPERARNISLKPTTAGYSSSLARTRSVHLHSAAHPQLHISQADEALTQALSRCLQYERKLTCLGASRRPRGTKKSLTTGGAPVIRGPFKGVVIQGVSDEAGEDRDTKTPPPQVPSGGRTKPLADPASRHRPPDGARKAESQMSSAEQNKVMKDTNAKVKVAESNAKQAAVSEEKLERQSTTMTGSSNKEKHGNGVVEIGGRSNTATEPAYHVVKLLEKGKTMCKVQARFAFATYLTRVQHRLMKESGIKDQEEVESANEQMDLVLRFLKRAAGNLQQSFRIVVPSRKLNINDRRRILAKQLGDFVWIYNKETEQLRQRQLLERKHIKRPPSFSQNEGLEEERFRLFVHSATEGELEDVLTTYTKLNKSASIFLGSNSKTVNEGRGHVTGGNHSNHTEASLPKRKEQGEHLPPGVDESDVRIAARPNSSYHAAVVYSNKMAAATARMRPHSAQVNAKVTSGAKGRPSSAVTSHPGSGLPPTSQRECPDGAESGPREEDLNSALHRLALRQQQRQYLATRSSILQGPPPAGPPPAGRPPAHPAAGQDMPSLRGRTLSLDSGASEGSRPNSGLDQLGGLIAAVDLNYGGGQVGGGRLGGSSSGATVAPPTGADRAPTSEGDAGSVRSRATGQSVGSKLSASQRSANETFASFVDDAGFHDNELVAAYHQVTGTLPVNSAEYLPTEGSTQLQVLQQKQQQQQGGRRATERERERGVGGAGDNGPDDVTASLNLGRRQQQLADQGRHLLEQSRAKHQAMVAQAHAAQQHHRTTNGTTGGATQAAGGDGPGDADLYPGTEASGANPAVFLPPRPPAKPPGEKRRSNNYRLARAVVVDGSSANSDFYNSLKYDSHAGSTKPVPSSSYTSGL